MIQSQGQTITNRKKVFQARRRLSQQSRGRDKLENPRLAPSPHFRYLNDLTAKMRTSLVPNRASLFRDAPQFTTTLATSRHHQTRNKTLETQTEMVRVLLQEPRSGRKVSVGARLAPSERPCPAE